MAKQKKRKNKSAPPKVLNFVICDTNVVILMSTFKPSVMFAFKYSFGAVEIHSSVIEEIENWIKRNGEKLRKFGLQFLEFVLEWCRKHTGQLEDVPEPQLSQGIKYLDTLESHLSPDLKGLATSRVDRHLLVLAFRRGVALATQELTLRSLAKRSLNDPKRIISFEDMLREILIERALTPQEARDCLSTLEKRDEHLLKGERKRILDLIEQLQRSNSSNGP